MRLCEYVRACDDYAQPDDVSARTHRGRAFACKLCRCAPVPNREPSAGLAKFRARQTDRGGRSPQATEKAAMVNRFIAGPSMTSIGSRARKAVDSLTKRSEDHGHASPADGGNYLVVGKLQSPGKLRSSVNQICRSRRDRPHSLRRVRAGPAAGGGCLRRVGGGSAEVHRVGIRR